MSKWIDNKAFDRLTRTQYGRISWAQLKYLGLSDNRIHWCIKHGYLIPLHPKVYAVGHAAPSREADLWAAILYAGPGAMLSHRTAAQWRGLIDYPPHSIDVSTPRQIKSISGIKVYGRRRLARHRYDHLPITSIPQTVLDLAAASDVELVRHALAVLDFRGEDVLGLDKICGRGRLGTTVLHQALATHQPELAHTRSKLELRFLHWCERHQIPVPQFNVELLPKIVTDAYWPEARLVVELDGYANHKSRAQLRNDKRKDLKLRTAGFTVHRYDWDLLDAEDVLDEVRKDLRGAQARPRPTPSAPPRRKHRPGRHQARRQPSG